MAYRRRQGNPRPTTYEDVRFPHASDEQPSSLAAQAIRASSAQRDSSLSSAYAESAFSCSSPSPSSAAYKDPGREKRPPPPQDSNPYEYTSIKTLNEPRHGFWGVLARKAKSIIEDDNAAQQFEGPNKFRPHKFDMSTDSQFNNFSQSHQPPESQRKKRLDALASSLNYIGGKVGNALEEGLSIVEHRTADIIQETRKLNIRRKGNGFDVQSQGVNFSGQHDISQIRSDQEIQLKASRDVANAMAAKAKLLIRELKTVKADLAFAKERCSQLEEENKMLRESRDKEDHPEDDDLIRLQLETLLAEKARLAHENSVYARENRFLREIVEFHQLTMQDVVYLDEGSEEVTEVYPIQLQTSSPRTSTSPSPSVPPSWILTPAVSLTHQSSLSSSPTPRTLSPQVSITLGTSSLVLVPSATTVQGIDSEAILGVADSSPHDAPEGRKPVDGA